LPKEAAKFLRVIHCDRLEEEEDALAGDGFTIMRRTAHVPDEVCDL